MLPLDADELYDLSEAGRLLWTDPVRLRRQVRLGKAPGVRREAGLLLVRAWVDAASGAAPTDPGAVLLYWRERLAPPPREARRPLKDRRLLPAEDLLDADAAARRVFADAARLARMDAEDVLPALRVDGATRYDPVLVALVADGGAEADARRAEVLGWKRFEYVTDLDDGAAAPPTETRPAAAEAVAAAPHAWRMPDTLKDLPTEALPEGASSEAHAEPERTQTDPHADEATPLIRAEGYETVDEDDA